MTTDSGATHYPITDPTREPGHTNIRTYGLTQNLLPTRDILTFRNAHTRIRDFDSCRSEAIAHPEGTDHE